MPQPSQHPASTPSHPSQPYIPLSSLPFPVLRRALQLCMAAAAPVRVLTRQLQPEEYEHMVSPAMEHVYEQSAKVRGEMVVRVAEVVSERLRDQAYSYWLVTFIVLLGRYERRPSTSDPSSTRGLSPQMTEWAKGWKLVTRIRSVTLEPEERRRLCEGMRELEGVVEEREKEGRKLPGLGDLTALAERCGAFIPLPLPPSPPAPVEAVQHSLAHMSRRKQRMYFGGTASSGGAGEGGRGW